MEYTYSNFKNIFLVFTDENPFKDLPTQLGTLGKPNISLTIKPTIHSHEL